MQLDYGQKERECATRTASGPRALRSCSGHRLLSSPGNGGGRPLREVHAASCRRTRPQGRSARDETCCSRRLRFWVVTTVHAVLGCPPFKSVRLSHLSARGWNPSRPTSEGSPRPPPGTAASSPGGRSQRKCPSPSSSAQMPHGTQGRLTFTLTLRFLRRTQEV